MGPYEVQKFKRFSVVGRVSIVKFKNLEKSDHLEKTLIGIFNEVSQILFVTYQKLLISHTSDFN